MHNHLLYDRHQAAGAVLLPEDESTPLLTYGAVPEEYAAATETAALLDRTDRGLLMVRGSEAGSFLHRLFSNVVESLEVGQGNRNLLLTGKGKIRFDFDLARVEDGFQLSMAPGQAAGLLEALDMLLFAEDVQLEDATSEHAPLLVCGPNAASILSGLCPELPSEAFHWVETPHEGGTLRITRLAPFGPEGYSLDAGPGRADALWAQLVEAGARPTGRVVADILRVEACRALAGEDIDENVYPQEARLEEAFSLSKGCYPGQEVVAKIDTYGGLNKRLYALRVSHSDPVLRGAKLQRWSEERNQWRELGMVTSWAYSFQHDSGQVLAYVKRRHQDPGTVFRLDDGPAEATLLDE